jgi:hypothetical protein
MPSAIFALVIWSCFLSMLDGAQSSYLRFLPLLGCTSIPSFFLLRWDLANFFLCPGWHGAAVLLTSACHIARITGVIHQHWACFYPTIVNNTATDMSLQMSLWSPAFNSFENIPRNGIIGLYGNPIFTYLLTRNFHTVFHSGSTIFHYHFPRFTRVPVFFAHSPQWLFSALKNI